LDRFEASGKAASEETFEGSVARVGKAIDVSMVVAGTIIHCHKGRD
jgi:hypothetical protein